MLERIIMYEEFEIDKNIIEIAKEVEKEINRKQISWGLPYTLFVLQEYHVHEGFLYFPFHHKIHLLP